MKVQDLRIMIIEDDPTVLATLRAMLTEIGIHHVFEAKDGDTAKQLIDIDVGMVDLLVCDWNMPKVTGIELLEHMRTKGINTPFLMVTGRNDISSVVEAKEKGVTGYIRKPFSMKELEGKIVAIAKKI